MTGPERGQKLERMVVYLQPELRHWIAGQADRRSVTVSSYVRERFAMAKNQDDQRQADAGVAARAVA